MKTSSAILNTELNHFSRKYLVKNNAVATADVPLFMPRHNAMVASFFEQLLLFDKVSFKVYGENIPLAILINQLGVEDLEQLIEENAIEFVLWTPVVTYTVKDIIGLLPLQSGNLNSPAHSDPDESINLGFDWLKNKPERRVRRAIQKKVRKAYRVPEQHFSHNAATFVMDAYKSNKLAALGMPNDLDIAHLPVDRRKKLCGYAENVLEATILSQFGYSSFQQYESFVLSVSTFDRIQVAIKLKENVGKVFELENIPDLKSLFLESKLDVKSLLRLRGKPDAVKFRQWLYSVTAKEDAKDITKEYIDSLMDSKGFFESKKGKFAKTISLYSLGAGIGALVAGIPGTLLGSSLAKIFEPAADLGLDLIDTYYLDGLLRGWNPRMFIDRLRSAIIADMESKERTPNGT